MRKKRVAPKPIKRKPRLKDKSTLMSLFEEMLHERDEYMFWCGDQNWGTMKIIDKRKGPVENDDKVK